MAQCRSARDQVEKIYAAAQAASRIYSGSWRRGNIIRAQIRLRNPQLTKRLVEFYLASLDEEVNHMMKETWDAE